MSVFKLSMFAVAIAGCGANGGGKEPTSSLYETADMAPSMSSDAIADLEHLGPIMVDLGTNFGVYSANAERVELLLFDDPDDELPVQQFPMIRQGDVWNIYVEGIGLGQHYGYVAWGPNWPYDEDFYPGSLIGFEVDVDEQGNRFNPNKLLFDPYARALHRDHDWDAGSLGTGESRRDVSTWGAAAKGIVIESEYQWSDAEAEWVAARANNTLEGHDWNEIVAYEVHPKGLTANGLEEVEHPGTYRGIGEMASYFTDLGVNAVEFLPVHEKPLDGGYWGYASLSFFAMELSYSSEFLVSDRPDLVVDEFKEMVDRMHQAGVEVWIDVVYNHTGEGGLWREKLWYDDYTTDEEATTQAYNLDSVEVAGLYSFRGLDNYSYYALGEDGFTYWNNTGVGNELRTNNLPVQRLILDSLRYMVEELHVDGFRFDLAGILGEQDLNYNYWYDDPLDSTLGVIIEDPVLQAHNTRIIAEPWTAGGNYNPVLGAYPASETTPGYGWGEWNAHFRDVWRSLINDDSYTLDRYEGAIGAGGALTGSYDLYAHNGRQPWHSLNFVTIHDGFTMYDLFSFDEKQNNCGVLNPVCCDSPTSSWCDLESGESNNLSRDWGVDNEPLKRQLMRDMFTLMMISHGTPLLSGGDEWLRTQYGNNNAYSSGADNEYNWFRWGEWRAYSERVRMHDFVRELIAFRRSHLYAFGPLEYGGGMALSWKDADNNDSDWSGKSLMLHYYEDGRELGPELVVLMNFGLGDVTFTLPEDRNWARALDTQQWFDTGDSGDVGFFSENPDADVDISANITSLSPEPVPDGLYTVKAQSIVILEQVND